MARGALILIEGVDRAGKTTQTELLLDNLKKRGRSVELIKFPDRTTPIGKLINSYLVDKSFSLSNESAHLLFSANRWELAPTIIQKLNDGVDIVLDRYVYSGVAYTAAKGIDTQWCYSPDIGLPRPDLTIFLSLDDTSDRAGFGNERYEVQEFQVKVKKQFELFFKEKGWSTIIVDGKSIEKVEKEISELVNSLLDKDLEEIELFI